MTAPASKDNPREWRNSVWMAAVGIGLFSTFLWWRHVLATGRWHVILCALAVAAVAAGIRPRWFRGYHRFTTRLSQMLAKLLGRCALALFFWVVLTPFAIVLRACGKDLLKLKRPASAETYWSKAPPASPLDRMF